METITIKDLQRINVERTNRWHPQGLSEWSELEWAGAMAGEAGEACNIAKKLKRLTGAIRNLDKRGLTSPVQNEQADEYRKALAEEVADTIIYGVLLIGRVGHDAEETIRRVFNTKSEEYDLPERL